MPLLTIQAERMQAKVRLPAPAIMIQTMEAPTRAPALLLPTERVLIITGSRLPPREISAHRVFALEETARLDRHVEHDKKDRYEVE